VLDPESNVLFGEGGAGAFSDGKLTSRSAAAGEVLDALVEAGAPAETLYHARPHVGTDLLAGVVRGLRRRIESHGGSFAFGTRAEGLVLEAGAVRGLDTSAGRLEAGAVVLAPGASARDTYGWLLRAGVGLGPKPFQMGVRIEHPQSLVDKAQYGRFAGHPRLGAAEYRLVSRGRPGAKAVYTFCMCPGGEIMAAVASARELSTNGMSRSARDGPYASSALVATFEPHTDFGGEPLAGVHFQARVERAAYAAGGGGWRAVAQRASDYLAGRATRGRLETSYWFGVVAGSISYFLPAGYGKWLARALVEFDNKISGFAGPEGVLVGFEARASGPVRVPRDERSRQSLTTPGLYPAGEGAGYAGGILSSAADGLRAARAVISRYRLPGT
jgi:uncharacterized FAD-dependent dehydrogenase